MPPFRRAAIAIVAGLLLGGVRSARAGELAGAVLSGNLSGAGRIDAAGGAAWDAADHVAHCRLLLFDNRAAQAEDCYAALAAAHPENAVRAGLARAASRLGKYADAAENFAAAGQSYDAARAHALAALDADKVVAPNGAAVVRFVSTDPLPVVAGILPDGSRHLFVLDTGAGETMLDPHVAAALHIAAIGAAANGTFAGGKTAPIQAAILPRLVLGDVALGNIPVTLLDTTPFRTVLGTAIDGVIGVDVLRHFTATIDYPARQLELRPPGSIPPPADARRFWWAGSHFLLAEAAIDGVPELALLDTGLAGQGCTVPQSTLDRIGKIPMGDAGMGMGGGGAISARPFIAKSVTSGVTTENGVSCLFGPFPPAIETATGTRIGLLVSHGFLRPYAVTLDFSSMRYWVKKGSK